MESLATCNCPMAKDGFERTHPALMSNIVGTPDVLFIGEAPGEEEDTQGEYFVGREGRLLRSVLSHAKYSYGFLNSVKCRPMKKSDYGNVVNRTPTPKEISACRNLLLTELSGLVPKLIVCLGKTAVKSLLSLDASIKSLRGTPILSSWDVPVLVTYHPGALIRNPDDDAIKKAFAEDIDNIQKFLESGYTRPKLIFVKSGEMSGYGNLLSNMHDPIAIDFETDILPPHKSKLLCVSFSYSETQALVFPLIEEDAIKFLSRLLPRIRKLICHNTAFDSRVSRHHFRYRFPEDTTEDTMIMHSLLYPDEPHSLEYLASIYRPDLGNYKIHTTGQPMGTYPLDMVMERCGYDTIATISAYNKMKNEVNDLLYRRLLMANSVLEDVMFAGAGIDIEELNRVAQQYDAQIEGLQSQILQWESQYNIQLWGKKKISPKQMSHLFYNIMKLPVLKRGKTGGSVDKKTLDRLAYETGNHDILKYIQYNSLCSLRDNTIKNLRENEYGGRLYTSYNIAGTTTGRLSSSSPQLQNITENLRGIFVPG